MTSRARIFRNIAIVLFLAFGHACYSQQAVADTLLKKFDFYRSNTLQEKVYVQTDRPSYLAGETLWFKVYVTDASLFKPLTLSKVVYVEILDRMNLPVLQTKIEITGGSGNGSLYLPPSLDSDHYTLRAYTNWMKNFAPELYFSKTVSVVNTFKQLNTPQVQNMSPNDIKFFPEGGNLVAGLKNKIAFQATDNSGKGISFRGFLMNQKNDTLISFEPTKFGIGNFTFTPQPNEVYKVKIRDASGRMSSHAFPVVSPEGYSICLSDSTDRLLLKVSSTNAGLEPVYLFVHTRNVVSKASYQFLQQGVTTFEIDKKKLGEGITHLTIFDAQLKPLCERLYFRQPENKIDISITPDESVYLNRRRVRLDVQSSASLHPVSAPLAVSVYRVDSLPAQDHTIQDYYWLTSDLKGTVESPGYYINGTPSPEKSRAIDNLMLTHGWRRFQWNDVLNTPPPITFLPEFRGHIIRGTVKKETGEPASGIITYLSSPGKVIRLFPSRSNHAGEIVFEMQRFSGSSRIVVQTNYKKDSLYKVAIVSPFSENFEIRPLPSLSIQKGLSEQLVQRSVAMQVQDIYFEEQLEAISRQSNDSTTFYGKPDETYYLDDFTRFQVMEEVMREYVLGVWVRKRKDGFHFMVPDRVHQTIFEDTPLMMIDGIPFFDEDEIMRVDPLKIKKLEVIARRYFLGPVSFSGIVSYHTYRSDLEGFELDPHAVTLNYEGLQRSREFYSPRYENPKQRGSRLPDQRTLLYWNPNVTTDADGKQKLEFYTSDLPGQYRVVVEGKTNDGLVGSGTTLITVNAPNN